MAGPLYYDRVQETTATTGTGTYTLAGAVTGYQSFSVVGNGNTTYYAATDGTDWEVGLGTWSTGGTLARTTVLASSNGGSAISWTAGSKQIWGDLPALFVQGLVNSTSAFSPAMSDGHALGTTALQWSDLFLASGGVINFANGDVTITHATDALAFAGASNGYTFDAWVAAPNFINSLTSTATAAGTTTLTKDSNYFQLFTGTTTQTVAMPVASTLRVGQEWFIENLSTGAVTVQSSGGNAILVLAAGTSARVRCILTSGTSAASWDAVYAATIVASGKALTVNNSLTLAGTDGKALTLTTGLTVSGNDGTASFMGSATTQSMPNISTYVMGAQQAGMPQNAGIAASVAGSALTIALKGVNGSDPSSSNPVVVPFRNVTATTGTPSYLAVTTATSLVISSGSTMGAANNTPFRLWIVAFNDNGTFRLGAVNALSGTNVMALGAGIYSSTAEGGSGGADSAQVIYTGSAVSAKALSILGYMEWSSGLSTAGTWASGPTLIQMFGPGISKPGDVVQSVITPTGAVATGTTTLPEDDTIPQITEGNEFMTRTITPTATPNILSIQAQGVYAFSSTSGTTMVQALFQDSTANALAAIVGTRSTAAANQMFNITLAYQMLAETTSSTTLRIRTGTSAAGTVTFNGSASTRQYGGALGSFLSVTEIMG